MASVTISLGQDPCGVALNFPGLNCCSCYYYPPLLPVSSLDLALDAVWSACTLAADAIADLASSLSTITGQRDGLLRECDRLLPLSKGRPALEELVASQKETIRTERAEGKERERKLLKKIRNLERNVRDMLARNCVSQQQEQKAVLSGNAGIHPRYRRRREYRGSTHAWSDFLLDFSPPRRHINLSLTYRHRPSPEARSRTSTDAEFSAKTIALYNRVVLGHASGLAPAPRATSNAAPAMSHLERLTVARAEAASQ
ncbi:hypothetical protein C8J57DRAFT_1707271 [Mycena rebaudengoi]|nr:hypothetical protein C8J57DRAFT_1707271 [Mycena rebaudengoi]